MPRPFWRHGTRLVPALPAADDPIETINPDSEIDVRQKRLAAQKTDGRRHSQQVRDTAIGLLLAFRRGSDPHVLRQPEHRAAKHLRDVLRALREQQPVDERRHADEVEEIAPPLRRDLIVEWIAETRKDAAANPLALRVTVPGQRLPPVSGGCPAPLSLPQLRLPGAFRPRFGIAVITGVAHLCAAKPRAP